MINLCTRLFPSILLICSVALALLLTLTHSVPLSDFGTGFSGCDTPCWAGITPGRTRFEDTVEMVEAHFVETDLNLLTNRLNFQVPAANLVGALNARQGYVDNIQVNVPQPLWATLVMLGTPQCIQYIDREVAAGLVNIFWSIDDVHVMSNVNLTRNEPAIMTNIVQLWLSPPESPCLTSDNTAPWPGFFLLE